MDSFELNKIAGAVLGSALLIMGVMTLADSLYAPEAANPQAFAVAGLEDGEGAGAPAAEEEKPLAVLLASADAGRGEKAAKKCTACHTFEEGGAARIGPNLYKVVGGPHAHDPNFAYSGAMKGTGGTWDFAALDAFIENPRNAVPGTAMSFAGIKKPQERADLLVYLNTLGSNVPLPEAPAQEEAPAEEAAPASEEAAPAE
jgi:cytochrome c